MKILLLNAFLMVATLTANGADGIDYAAVKEQILTLAKTSKRIPNSTFVELEHSIAAIPLHDDRPDWSKRKFEREVAIACLLSVVYSTIDWNFDLSKFPVSHVDPPTRMTEMTPDGLPPDAIKDPVLRAEYVAAIKANDAYRIACNEQWALRKEYHDLEDLFSIQIIYFFSPADKAKLKSILKSEPFLNKNRAQIAKWLSYK